MNQGMIAYHQQQIKDIREKIAHECTERSDILRLLSQAQSIYMMIRNLKKIDVSHSMEDLIDAAYITHADVLPMPHQLLCQMMDAMDHGADQGFYPLYHQERLQRLQHRLQAVYLTNDRDPVVLMQTLFKLKNQRELLSRLGVKSPSLEEIIFASLVSFEDQVVGREPAWLASPFLYQEQESWQQLVAFSSLHQGASHPVVTHFNRYHQAADHIVDGSITPQAQYAQMVLSEVRQVGYDVVDIHECIPSRALLKKVDDMDILKDVYEVHQDFRSALMRWKRALLARYPSVIFMDHLRILFNRHDAMDHRLLHPLGQTAFREFTASEIYQETQKWVEQQRALQALQWMDDAPSALDRERDTAERIKSVRLSALRKKDIIPPQDVIHHLLGQYLGAPDWMVLGPKKLESRQEKEALLEEKALPPFDLNARAFHHDMVDFMDVPFESSDRQIEEHASGKSAIDQVLLMQKIILILGYGFGLSVFSLIWKIKLSAHLMFVLQSIHPSWLGQWGVYVCQHIPSFLLFAATLVVATVVFCCALHQDEPFMAQGQDIIHHPSYGQQMIERLFPKKEKLVKVDIRSEDVDMTLYAQKHSSPSHTIRLKSWDGKERKIDPSDLKANSIDALRFKALHANGFRPWLKAHRIWVWVKEKCKGASDIAISALLRVGLRKLEDLSPVPCTPQPLSASMMKSSASTKPEAAGATSHSVSQVAPTFGHS